MASRSLAFWTFETPTPKGSRGVVSFKVLLILDISKIRVLRLFPFTDEMIKTFEGRLLSSLVFDRGVHVFVLVSFQNCLTLYFKYNKWTPSMVQWKIRCARRTRIHISTRAHSHPHTHKLTHTRTHAHTHTHTRVHTLAVVRRKKKENTHGGDVSNLRRDHKWEKREWTLKGGGTPFE